MIIAPSLALPLQISEYQEKEEEAREKHQAALNLSTPVGSCLHKTLALPDTAT